MAQHYRELVAWQRAMDLVTAVYRISALFPREELYGLTAQVRRAAVSVAANIAEGQGRGAGNEFAHYLRIARGSVQEVETQLLVAERLGYVSETLLKEALAVADEVSRLITGLSRSLSNREG
jgi:four helix bundle protein